MDRREFITALGSAAAASQLGCATAHVTGTRQLSRVGIQLYSLRDDAKRDLEGTIANIAQAGYKDVELLGSMNNFGMLPARLRTILDRNGLRAPSTHVSGTALDDLPRQLDEAAALGHQYIVVASLPIEGTRTVSDYQRWADKLNEAGRISRKSNVWIGFHNHAADFDVPGAYDALEARTDPNFVRLQLDTGNLAMAGRDPIEYLKRFGDRYWLFHIKDVPQLRA
ncbi:MAG: sugar phosphate isomerase/epimerase, partial [Gemmatimonadales bacterium]